MGCLKLDYYEDLQVRTCVPMLSHESKMELCWLSIDPLAEETPNWSPYACCNNNPLYFIDPTGMSSESNDWHPDKNGNLVADAGDSTKSLAEYQGISYDQAAKQLSDNGYTTNDKGILNLNVGDAVNTGSFNLQEVVVQGSSKKGGSDSSTPWMDKAMSQLGVSEIRGSKHNPDIIGYHSTTGKFKTDEVPWCASFVNWSLETSGISSLGSASAFSYMRFGNKLNQPAYGALAIMKYSHVGFVAGLNSDGRLILLGGNQGDAVNLSPNAMSQVKGYRYPTGLTPNYNLPKFNLKGRSTNAGTSR